jgi:hypothetical protein
MARARRHRQPGWPLYALLCLYPLWWALGLGAFAFIIFAVPMAWELRLRRPVKLPPAYGLWLLFLGWTVLSLTMLALHPPNTLAGSTMGRALGIVFRLVQLAAVTVIAVYVVNLPSKEVSLQRVMRWLAALYVVTIGGGLLAIAMPHFSFTSPLEFILPGSISSNRYVQNLVHPQAAEVQAVLGYTAPRPAAPWGYTNFWGNCLSVLLPWFCLYHWRGASHRRRLLLAAAVAVSLVPIVYSLNRGLWLGLVLTVGYLIFRLTANGDLRAVVTALVLLPVGVFIFLLTPLHTMVVNRTSHSGSANIRAFADHAAIDGANASPILGWGGAYKTLGSSQSIQIGPSPRCPNCGSVTIGSTGEFWEIVFTTGWVGAAIYFSFFVGCWWRLRRNRTPVGAAARLIVLLAIFYCYFYNNVPSALALTFITVALAWRQIIDPEPLPTQAAAVEPPEPAIAPLVALTT